MRSSNNGLPRWCWLLILSGLFSLGIRAQAQETSLRTRLQRASDDRERQDVLLELSKTLLADQPEEALDLARQALQLAQKRNDAQAEAESYGSIAAAYAARGETKEAVAWLHAGLAPARRSRDLAVEVGLLTQLARQKRLLSELDSAIFYARQSLALQEKAGIHPKASDNFFEIGVAYDLKGTLDSAMNNLLRALEEAERSQAESQTALVLNSLGIVQRSARNYDKALEYYHRAQTLYEKLGDRRSQANILHNIGDLYLNTGDFDRGMTFTLRGKAIREEIADFYGLAYSYQNLAFAYFTHFKDYRQAFQSDSLAYEMRRKIGDRSGMATTLNDMAWDLFSLGQTKEAYRKSREALDLARQLGTRAVERNCLELLAEIAEKQGEYRQALGLQKQYFRLKDSLFNAEKNQVIQELQVKYETTRKEQQLSENQSVIRQRTTQRNWLFAVAVSSGLLALSVFLGLQSRLRYNQRLAAQSAELQARRIRELEQIQKIVALDAMIQGQEEERQRVAKDLHDGLGGLLSSIKHHFRAVREQYGQAMTMPVFQRTDVLLDEAHEEVRRIAHNLMPDALSKLGLLAAVEDQAESYRSAGLQISVQNLGWNTPPDVSRDLMLYRIAQELLQNIARHAQASQVFIQFSQFDNSLVMTVEDNGAGFDLSRARSAGGLGLKNIESRLAYLGGTMDIETAPGKGTVTIIRVPLHTDPEEQKI